MRACQCRQPNKQARILGAQTNPLFGKRDRLLRMAAVKVHLPKQNMSGGIAGIEIDRLLERRHREIGAMHPHADETEREMGCRISGVETDRALGELISLELIACDVIYPAQVGGVAKC